MRAARAMIVVLAVAAAGWFLLAAREARDVVQATDIVTQSAPITAAQAQRASSLLDSAARLNPDRQTDLLRAALAAKRGHDARARQLIQAVTSAEPENVGAWYLLAEVSGGDRPIEALALKRIAELHPPVP